MADRKISTFIEDAALSTDAQIPYISPGAVDKHRRISRTNILATIRTFLAATETTWSSRQIFTNGNGSEGAIVASGNIDAAGATGAKWKVAVAGAPINGTNGSRAAGDSIASDEALDVASYAAQIYANFTGASAHTGKGGAHGVVVFGEMGSNSAYGEACAVAGQMTNNRDGGLAEGAEFTVIDTTGGGRSNGIVIITRAMAPITRWFRGIWLTSQGSNPSGDALYVDGASGWTNFAVFKDTAGTTKFQIDGSGNTTVGGGFYASGLFRNFDPSRFVTWFPGNPEGVIGALPGSIILNTNGGAGTTIYVKESGTGTTGWVGK